MRINEILAYHGTDSNITQFRPLTHFGSEKAAKDRMAYKKIGGKIYQVELDIKNPAVIKDFAGVHSPMQFAFALNNAKILSHDEMLTVTQDLNQDDSIKTGQLVKLLKSKGYDGIAYKNRYEDKGHVSYVILDPSQSRVVNTINENTRPQILYHATYRPLIKSIKQYGLGGDLAQAKWEDSKPGVVYLATDPNVAESYAESSDVVPDEWLDKIVVLKIDASKLDQSKLIADQNVLDNQGDTLEYHGVIPSSLIS